MVDWNLFFESSIFILAVINLKHSPSFLLLETFLKVLIICRSSRLFWIFSWLSYFRNLLINFFESIWISRWVLAFIGILII